MDPEQDCRITRSVYMTECLVCLTDKTPSKSVCVGSTGWVSHKRQREHMGIMKSKSIHNAQSKHHWETHPNQEPNYKTTFLKGGFRNNGGLKPRQGSSTADRINLSLYYALFVF